jgi:hypothetical protein
MRKRHRNPATEAEMTALFGEAIKGVYLLPTSAQCYLQTLSRHPEHKYSDLDAWELMYKRQVHHLVATIAAAASTQSNGRPHAEPQDHQNP